MIDKLEISDVSSDSFNSEEEEEEEIPELEGISEANEEDEFSSIRGGSRSRNQSHKREKGKSTSKFKPPSLSESDDEGKKVGNSFEAEEGSNDVNDISVMMVFDSTVILELTFENIFKIVFY